MQSPRRKLHPRQFVVCSTGSREEQFSKAAWNVWGKIFGIVVLAV